MKHTLRDIFIRAVSALGITTFYRARKRKQGPLVRILCFHDIADGKWFEEIVQTLLVDYHILTPRHFQKRCFHRSKINILLTFDDGYRSWVNVVLPILTRHKIKGLFFVCSGLLDVAGDKKLSDIFMKEKLLITPKKALSWSGVKKLVAAGHTMGGHTQTHSDLSSLESRSLLYREVAMDKDFVESRVSVRLFDFAYPFGTRHHVSNEARSYIQEVGYTRIYTAEAGFVESDALEIPRTLIEYQQPVCSIKRWIDGGYDIFTICKKAIE